MIMDERITTLDKEAGRPPTFRASTLPRHISNPKNDRTCPFALGRGRENGRRDTIVRLHASSSAFSGSTHSIQRSWFSVICTENV
jgi:hypothetical protein